MTPSTSRPRREPVQVYLDRHDLDLLDELIQRSGLSKAELLRRGLRRMADLEFGEASPGRSLASLIGALDGSDLPLPFDLSVRHDDYLYGRAAGSDDRPGPD